LTTTDELSPTELADLVAQAVIDRLEERSKVNMLVELVIRRMAEIQQEESKSTVTDGNTQ
jgi:hypothetical protein